MLIFLIHLRTGFKYHAKINLNQTNTTSKVFCTKNSNIPNKMKSSINHSEQNLSYSMVAGLGLWRIRSIVKRKIYTIVTRLEGIIRQCCTDDDLDVFHCKEYEYWDTKDPTGRKTEIDLFSSTSHSPSKRNNQDRPRLQIENRIYTSRVFRKIHIGVAVKENGHQVINFIMYPRPQFFLPILYMDIAVNQNDVLEAIVEIHSVRMDKTLPKVYLSEIKSIQNNISNSNSLPKWGQTTSSPVYINVKLTDSSEFNDFINYLSTLSRLHLEIAYLLKPIPPTESGRIEEIAYRHYRFCEKSTKNENTLGFIASSFGKVKAEKYMRNFMFDVTRYK